MHSPRFPVSACPDSRGSSRTTATSFSRSSTFMALIAACSAAIFRSTASAAISAPSSRATRKSRLAWAQTRKPNSSMTTPSAFTMSDRPRLAYIGVGLMGGPMSERLSSLGYPVCAFDIDSARLTAAERAGAGRAKDAADAASNAELVLLNLPSAQAVEEAAFGSHGFARGLRPPQLVVDFSTISAATCREFAERVAQSSGCGWVDAPVSGGPVAAANGSLTIMAGGSDADIGRVQPLMGEIGQQFTHVGPTGAGSVAKTIAQLVVGCTYVVLAEAARLAEGAGIDPAILPRCVSKGHADGVLMQHLYPRVAAHDFA